MLSVFYFVNTNNLFLLKYLFILLLGKKRRTARLYKTSEFHLGANLLSPSTTSSAPSCIRYGGSLVQYKITVVLLKFLLHYSVPRRASTNHVKLCCPGHVGGELGQANSQSNLPGTDLKTRILPSLKTVTQPASQQPPKWVASGLR
jgi:hypothetical protein